MEKASIESAEELEAIYHSVSVTSTKKVIESFDAFTTGFLQSARFVAANVRDAAGKSVPVMLGGPTGFFRVVDLKTAEIELAAAQWPQDRLPVGPDIDYEVGLLLVIPGVSETMRLRGRLSIKECPDTSGFTATLTLRSTFFHCGKAFLRGKVWPTPAERWRWRGLRAFRCVEKVEESAKITSFYLRPVDNRPLPLFTPGQHVVMELAAGGEAPLRRVYSLSDRPGKETWRITVKREPGPDRASVYLHERFNVGDVVQLRAPSGGFRLDLRQIGPWF